MSAETQLEPILVRRAFAGAYSEENLKVLSEYVQKNVNINWPRLFYTLAKKTFKEYGIPEDLAHQEAMKVEFEILSSITKDHMFIGKTQDFTFYKYDVKQLIKNKIRRDERYER